MLTSSFCSYAPSEPAKPTTLTRTSYSRSSLCSNSDNPASHSFPTRRSSDLRVGPGVATGTGDGDAEAQTAERAGDDGGAAARSEEHTSELQSRFDLVWRLLLEKKIERVIAEHMGAVHGTGRIITENSADETV